MKIGIVLVTYNRKEELKKALKSYENQTKVPQYVLVVNNNSTDGTTEFLDKWKEKESTFDKHVINLKENMGGSGGFYTGLKDSLELEAEWVWVADDDAYPQVDALENIEKFFEGVSPSNKDHIACICGTVINNNKIDIAHRRRINQKLLTIEEVPVQKEEYEKNSFEIDLFSYVGTVINKKYLKEVGLTEKDYFIYYDDTEHALRLSKKGKVICIPDVKVIHDTALQNREPINWKTYYGMRNRLHVYKKHFPKRYFLYSYAKEKIKILLSKDRIYKELLEASIGDAKNEVKGLHAIYRPGWKYN